MNIEIAGEYEGDYLNGRFHGRGVYKLNGNQYEGNFYDGQFHGEGKLIVKGGSYQGHWKQGVLVDGGFIFEDGLPHLKVGYKYWEYCSQYDQRFYNEIKDGIKNGDKLRDQTSHKHAALLPKDMYDTIDGYYDTKKHTVFSYETNEVVRMPDQDEADIIMATCRVGK